MANEDFQKLTIGKAINLGLRRAMEEDPKVLMMGEDVGKLGGVFRITDGLQKDFGERGVDDALLTEVFLQAVGNAEDAAELSDVFAEQHDLGVTLHGATQTGVDCLTDGERLRCGGRLWCGRHQCASPAKDSKYWANSARCESSRGEPLG